MAYTPDPTDFTQPIDTVKASYMGAEFRALKAYIHNTLLPLIGTGSLPITGGILTGNINVMPPSGLAAVSLSRPSVAVQNSIFFNTGGSSISWQIYQQNNQLGLKFYYSGFGDVLTLGIDGSVSGSFIGPLNGNAASASVVPWSGVSGKPTLLSQFTNDVGFLTGIAWTSVTGRPTLLSQFTNDIGAGGGGGGAVASVQGRTGAVTLNSTDITGALGFTPYNNSNPSNYASLAQVAAAGYQTSSGFVANATNASNVTGTTSNGYGQRTVSSSAPSGGNDGDIWYQV